MVVAEGTRKVMGLIFFNKAYLSKWQSIWFICAKVWYI